MYDKLVGKAVKIVFLDGNRTRVEKCTILEWDAELKVIHIMTTDSQDIYIPAHKIEKLEVME